MSNKTPTPTEEEYKKAVKIITAELEPRIEKLVANLNKFMAKFDLSIGVELKWFIERKTDENKKN